MRAMVLREPRFIEESPLVELHLDIPTPGDSEILVRIAVCGVCHTDLHTVEGELAVPKLPVIPGHQIVGRVEAIGSSVTLWRVGDRVGIPWLHDTCGQCRHCRSGKENLCENAHFTGLHVDGGYAEYVVVNEAFACAIPPVFDDEHAAPLLCAGIIGYRSLRIANYQPGKTLALIGFGASAHITLQLAVGYGSRVAVYSRSKEHRRLAYELGAAWAGEIGQAPPFPIESAITFAPVGEVIHAALGVLDRGGTLAINAVHMSSIPELPYAMMYHERAIRSVANATRDDASQFLKQAAAVGIKTHIETFELADANRALQRLKASRVQGAAVLQVAHH